MRFKDLNHFRNTVQNELNLDRAIIEKVSECCMKYIFTSENGNQILQLFAEQIANEEMNRVHAIKDRATKWAK